MPFTHDLEAAGRRAALQPVHAPASFADMQQSAKKQRTKRRLMGGSVAALALVAASVPIALNTGRSTSIQTVTAGGAAQEVAPAAQGGSSINNPPLAAQDDTEDNSERARIELRTDGDSYSIRVIDGAEAQAAAEAAEANAEETLDVDGVTVWIARSGDQATVSASIDGDKFIQVQGPADQIDKLIDMAKSGDFHHDETHSDSFKDFDGHALPEDFFNDFDGHALPEDFFQNFNGNFEGFFKDFDGEFNGEFPGNFGDFFEDFDGEFDGNIEDFLKDFDGKFPNFEHWFSENGEFPDFGQSFDGSGFGPFGKDFTGCIAIDIDDDVDGQFSFEYPEGCESGG